MTHSAAFGFVVLDVKCVIQYSNLACADLFEMEQDSLINQEFESFLADESKGLITRFVEFLDRPVSSLELQLNLKSGKIRRVQARVQPFKNNKGEFACLTCSFLDATQQIDAQIALIREFAFQSELEDLGRQIIGENDFNAVAEKSIKCCMNHCNWQLAGLIFRTPNLDKIDSCWVNRGAEEFPADLIEELSQERNPLTEAIFDKTAHKEHSRVHDIKGWSSGLKERLADQHLETFHSVDLWMGDTCIGVLVAAETKGEPVPVEDLGRVQNIALLVTSALQNAHLFNQLQLNNEKLEKTVEQLEEANRHRDQFYRFLIHDLNKPLAAIVGTSSRILKRTDLDNGLMERLARINNSSLRLRDYVEEMLNEEKIRRGDISLNIKKVRVVKELIDLAEMISEKHREMKIAVREEPKIEEPILQTDSFHFHRILQNLMDNAAKYGDGKVECRVSNDGSMFTIGIWNNGKPIPNSDRETIFEEFFQRGEKRTEGFGIGLASVKHLVNHLRGKISVECPECGGTEFILTFPSRWTERESTLK